MPTPTPRTTRTLPSQEELAATVAGFSGAFNVLERLHWQLEHIMEDWQAEIPAKLLSQGLNEEELTRAIAALEPSRAPAAGPSLTDIGAIYSCLDSVRLSLDGMETKLAELDRNLGFLDAMRLDIEVAEGALAA
jgi:hypothetical protein